jgi:hypothetical protein
MSDIESENENGEVSALKRKETNEPLFVATLVKTYPIVLSKSKMPSHSGPVCRRSAKKMIQSKV